MKKSFKKYFIPNQENDHKPHFLREKSVIAMTALASLLLLASIIGSYVVKNSKFLAAIQSAFLVDLANEDRANEGQGKLVINDKLVFAAQLKANDMAQKSYFAHISPEGVTPWHWFEEAGYSYIYAGENLAVNFSRSEDVEEAWMNSPLHRANILNNRYKEIGIATAEGTYKGNKTTFVVQMFGTQASPALQTVSASQEATVTSVPAPTSGLVAVSTESSEVEGDSDTKLEFVTPSKQATQKTIETKIAKAETLEVKTQIQEVFPPSEQTFTETTNPEYENQNVAGAEDSSGPVYTNWFERFLVSPGSAVNSAYIILFVIILFSLILKIFVAINKQHPKNIAYGVLLLILILIFMYINQEMFVTPVVAAM